MAMSARAAAWRAFVLVFAWQGAALAEHDRGAFPLEDRLQLLVQPRSVLMIDGETGGQREEPFELGERVLAQGVDGRVAFAVTDRRILAIAAGSGAFQEARFTRGEALATPVALGDRVLLFVTNRRVIGFDGGSGNLVETRPAARRCIYGVANSCRRVTTRRALGLAVSRWLLRGVSGLDEAATLSATGDVATLATRERILTFRAATGGWEERRLGLGN
jgi:hypothetical protein